MPISDDDLLILTDVFISEAVKFIEEEIADDRIKGRKYYRGDKFGNEVKGRSQVVSTDVRDAIEWTMPSLMRVFFQGDEPISIHGVNEEDNAPAKAAQAWCTHVVTRMNPGFSLYMDWFKDSLKLKNGFMTAYWVEETTIQHEQYQGLTEPDYQMLTSDAEYEIEEETEYEQYVPIRFDPAAPPLQIRTKLYDVKVRHTIPKNSIRLECLNPEDVFTLEDTIDNKRSRFWLHRPRKTISDLREAGYDISDDADTEVLPCETMTSNEIMEKHRHGYDPLVREDQDKATLDIDPSMKKIYFYQMDLKVDMDGDGIAEWWRICRVGNDIVSKDPVPYPMYASLTPYPNSHMLFGDSYADIIGAFQELKTSMHRIVLDYIYYSTNPRSEIAMDKWSDEFTFDDWLNNAPNSMVRVRESGAITPLYPAPLQSQTLSLLEYWESQAESRIGVTRYSKGLDADSLNKTAAGVTNIMQAASERIELIARIFAETGVKTLVNCILDLTAEYPEQAEGLMARLADGKQVPVTPENIRGNFDFVCNVGVGTGDKAQIMQALFGLFGMYEKMIAMGAGPTAQNRLVSWRNLYNLVKEYVTVSGIKNVSDFTVDPEAPRQPGEAPPPPPQKDAQTIATEQQGEYLKLEAQYKAKELMLKAQMDATKLQLEQDKLRLERWTKDRELDIKEAQTRIDARDKGIAAGLKISDSTNPPQMTQ
jgi:hypothetical protein